MLFDEQPIVIDRTLAKVIGFNEAIVIQQVHYWLEVNRKQGRNFINGINWTYNSLREWHEKYFDFWSYDTVKRTFQSLEKDGLLISNNFNKDKRDRTKWYSINYEKLKNVKKVNAKCIGANCTNDTLGQNAPMEWGKLNQPLPENNKQRFTTENKQQRQDMNVEHYGCRRSDNKEIRTRLQPEIEEVEKLVDCFEEQLGIERSQARETATNLLKYFIFEQVSAKIPCAVGQTFTKGLGAFLRAAIQEDWPVPVKGTARNELKKKADLKKTAKDKYKDIYMS